VDSSGTPMVWLEAGRSRYGALPRSGRQVIGMAEDRRSSNALAGVECESASEILF
jgi:hypothetical protein